MGVRIQELAVHLEARFPAVWEKRVQLAAFALLFLIFFIINLQLLKLPETLRRTLNASPLAHVAYTDATIRIFPPALELKDAALGGPALRGAVLRFDTLTIRPILWRFFTGKAAIRATALAGGGSATLDAATGGAFDFTFTSFGLRLNNMPLRVLEALEQYDPDIDGAVSVQVRGETRWINAAGLLIPRDTEMTASGRIHLASARNGLAALTFDRFRNGMFHFDLAVSGRVATIQRMDFTEQSCSAVVSGRALIDWRNVANSELNLTAEVKARPEYITPVLLMNADVRQSLEQGQSLPFVLQGALNSVHMRPVF